MNNDSKKLLKTSVIYSIGQIISQIISFFLIPVYTKKLGSIEYGQIAIISSISGFITTFMTLSIYTGVGRFYKDTDDKNKLINTALNFSFFSSAVIVTVIVLVGRELSTLLFKLTNSYEILIIVIFTAIFNQIILIYITKYSMEYRALKVSIINFIKTLVQFLFIIYFIFFRSMGIMGVLYGQLIVAVITFSYLFFSELKQYKLYLSFEMLKDMMIFSSGLLPVAVSGWILTLSDRYFLSTFRGYSETGIYNLGYQLGMLINTIFITPFLNSFTAYKFENYKFSDSKLKFRNLFRKYNVIGCFILLSISVFSKIAITILASSDFIVAYKIVPLILYSYFLYGKSGYYGLGFQLANKTYITGIYMFFAAILNISLNFYAVPKYGMLGAATTTIISYFVLNCIFMVTSQKEYKIYVDFKHSVTIEAITTIFYLVYYFITFNNVNIFVEFIVGTTLLVGFIFFNIKIKFIKVDKLVYYKILAKLKKFLHIV